MGDLTRTERNEIEQMKRDVAALKKMGVSGGLSLTRGPGGQMVIGGASTASGFYAALTGGTTSPYSFAEVAGPALSSAVVAGGRTGTLNAYEQLTGLAAIPIEPVPVIDILYDVGVPIFLLYYWYTFFKNIASMRAPTRNRGN